MNPRILLSILIVSGTLAGCFDRLQRDFNNLTLVGRLRLGDSKVFRRQVILPPGEPQLVIAIPDYRCSPIGDYPITFTVIGGGEVEFSTTISLSRLTWSYAQNSCDAVGFLRENRNRNSSLNSHAMSLNVKSDKFPVTVEVDTAQIKTTKPRKASVWFIYGERAPLKEIFGSVK